MRKRRRGDGSSLPTRVIGFQQVARIGWRNMMPDALCVLQALVLDDASSRLLHAIENGPQRPGSEIDDGVFNPRFVLECVGSSHVIALDDMNVRAVEVACLIQP